MATSDLHENLNKWRKNYEYLDKKRTTSIAAATCSRGTYKEGGAAAGAAPPFVGSY